MILAEFDGSDAERKRVHPVEHRRAQGRRLRRRVVARRGRKLVRERDHRCGSEVRRRPDFLPRLVELRSRVLGDGDRPCVQAEHAFEGRTHSAAGKAREGERDEIVEEDNDVAPCARGAFVGIDRTRMSPESAADVELVARPKARSRNRPDHRDFAARELPLQQRSNWNRQRKPIHAPNVGKNFGGRLPFFFEQRIEIVVQTAYIREDVGPAIMQSQQRSRVFDLDALDAGQIFVEDRVRRDVGKIDVERHQIAFVMKTASPGIYAAAVRYSISRRSVGAA